MKFKTCTGIFIFPSGMRLPGNLVTTDATGVKPATHTCPRCNLAIVPVLHEQDGLTCPECGYVEADNKRLCYGCHKYTRHSPDYPVISPVPHFIPGAPPQMVEHKQCECLECGHKTDIGGKYINPVPFEALLIRFGGASSVEELLSRLTKCAVEIMPTSAEAAFHLLREDDDPEGPNYYILYACQEDGSPLGTYKYIEL